VPYFHLVFTLPHEINPLVQGNPKVIYGLLFQAASETLQTFGRGSAGRSGSRWCSTLGAQNLSQHLHVHCVVSGGALGPDGRWIPTKRGFLFPVRALSVSVSAPRAPQGLHADPALWPPRQSPPHRAPGRLPGRPPPPHLTKQKPRKSSSFECSGPMCTAARTVAKDGCARSKHSPLFLGPPAHPFCDGPPEPNGQEPGFCEVQDEPLRLSASATPSAAAARRLASTPPIDRFPPLDHTSS
jgi:putative transposase